MSVSASLALEDSRRDATSQQIGTWMVLEAQMESGVLDTQDSGGSLEVTKMLAAVTMIMLFSGVRVSEGAVWERKSEGI